MSQHLIEKIQSYIEIEEEDRQFIQSAFKPRRYAKGEHFLLAGDVCREAAFVERGVFRFYINLEGEEATYIQVSSQPLMEAVDSINLKYGHHTVRPLAIGNDREWEMKRGRRSGRYTTRLDEVLRVRAG